MASQRLLTSTARTAFTRPASSSLACSGAAPLSRALHSRATPRPTTRPSWATYGGASLALTLPFSLFSGSGNKGEDVAASEKSAPSSTDSNSPSTSSGEKVESKSSTILREASPAAMRSQPTTLLFLSVKGSQRYEWQEWIGYFREAGYDVLDCNLDAAISGKDKEAAKVLGDELASQVRLSSLQRHPLVFIKSSASPLALPVIGAHLASPKASVAGVVIVSSLADGAGTVVEEFAKKLGGRVKVVRDDEEGVRESERWLTEQGF